MLATSDNGGSLGRRSSAKGSASVLLVARLFYTVPIGGVPSFREVCLLDDSGVVEAAVEQAFRESARICIPIEHFP